MTKHLLTIAAILLLCPAMALADGGTLRLRERAGDFQISVFTSPEVLRVGPIDISVLVQDADTGRVRLDVPVQVELHQLDSPKTAGDRPNFVSAAGQNGTVPFAGAGFESTTGVLLEKPADIATATNKLFQAAQFDIPVPGRWSAEIEIGAQSVADQANAPTLQSPLTFQFDVAPPRPPWLDLAPWVAWPLVVVALFIVHQLFAGPVTLPPESASAPSANRAANI